MNKSNKLCTILIIAPGKIKLRIKIAICVIRMNILCMWNVNSIFEYHFMYVSNNRLKCQLQLFQINVPSGNTIISSNAKLNSIDGILIVRVCMDFLFVKTACIILSAKDPCEAFAFQALRVFANTHIQLFLINGKF